MTLCFAAKEKKQKSKFDGTSTRDRNFNNFSCLFPSLVSVMRLGKKKEKDRDGEKEQCIDGVSRLICSAKQSHPVPLRGKQTATK